jgi:cell shape-determining protein MreC
LIVAELAEASQEEEELRRRNQELEQQDGRQTERVEELRRQNQELQEVQMIVNGAVQGTVVVQANKG